jgi:sporadic carbohydrate cluster protein (TIGR04323 family)
MSTATVTTDINIGPFKIPSNGQNMIMNNYAQRNNIKVEFVIPEPMMSNRLATTKWCHKDYKFSKIILCSIYQLPKEKMILDELIIDMQDVEFHFALEGLSGKGKDFIFKCVREAEIFEKASKIDAKQHNWLDLFVKFQNSLDDK